MKQKRLFKTLTVVLSCTSILYFNSCKKEEMPERGNEDAELLDCSIFTEDIVLEKNPERNVDYLIDCRVRINGSKLTIEPGVIIEFTENGWIEQRGNSEGIISAIGTANDPIIFRGTKNSKGHWKGIKIGSDNNENELKYIKLQDAGKENLAGLRVGTNAHLKLSNSEISNNKEAGLSIFTATPFVGVDVGEYAVNLTNNRVFNNAYPVSVHVQNVNNLTPGNDFSGNDRDEIEVETGNSSGYRILQDVTWNNLGMPYILRGGDVRTRGKLTIEPGVIMKFDLNANLTITKDGSIHAVGTEEKPIVFTSIENTPQYWRSIQAESEQPVNEIAYAIIENTGNESTGSRWKQGNVVSYKTSHVLNIHDVKFRNINPKFCAVRGPVQVSNISIEGHDPNEVCEHNEDHRQADNDYDMP